MGGAVFPSCYLPGPNYGEGSEDRPPLKGPMHALLHSVPPALHQATADPHLCQRLLDTYEQIWVSLLWGQCSFLLGPATHKVLFMPAKSLFPSSV